MAQSKKSVRFDVRIPSLNREYISRFLVVIFTVVEVHRNNEQKNETIVDNKFKYMNRGQKYGEEEQEEEQQKQEQQEQKQQQE